MVATRERLPFANSDPENAADVASGRTSSPRRTFVAECDLYSRDHGAFGDLQAEPSDRRRRPETLANDMQRPKFEGLTRWYW